MSIYRQNHCALKYSEHEIVLVGGQVDDQAYFNNIVAFDYKQKTSSLVVDLSTFGIQLSAGNGNKLSGEHGVCTVEEIADIPYILKEFN